MRFGGNRVAEILDKDACIRIRVFAMVNSFYPVCVSLYPHILLLYILITVLTR